MTEKASDANVSSDQLSTVQDAVQCDPILTQEETIEKVLSRKDTQVNTNSQIIPRDPEFEISWDGPGDLGNPRNWSFWYKGVIVFFVSFANMIMVMYSTSYTSSIPGMMEDFQVTSDTKSTLGFTTYFLGMACGSVIVSPLGEVYGRRPVYLTSLLLFTLWALPCALAPNIVTVIIARFFAAIPGSVMVSNSPGTITDIMHAEHVGLAISISTLGPFLGPILGPVVGGFIAEYLGWRWTNWVVMILSGISFFMLCCVQETYAPALLRTRTKRKRKQMNDDRYWCRYDLDTGLKAFFKNMARPFVLTSTEPILWFWDIYEGLIYGTLYLYFVAYPLVYRNARGWSIAISGLAFIGMGIGSIAAIGLEPLFRRLINLHKKNPKTGRPYPEASMSVICIAAFLSPIGQVWFAWTCLPPVHWVWSILSGIPFGMSFTLLYIYPTGYIAGSYGIFAASALSGTTFVRSIMAGVLPLAGPSLYARLNVPWACTMLALIEIPCIPVAFVFYKWGDKLRMRSQVICEMEKHESTTREHRDFTPDSEDSRVAEEGARRGKI